MTSDMMNGLGNLAAQDSNYEQIVPPRLPAIDQAMELAKMMTSYNTPEEIGAVLLAAAKVYQSWGTPVYIVKHEN